jgi:hypothetical protein
MQVIMKKAGFVGLLALVLVCFTLGCREDKTAAEKAGERIEEVGDGLEEAGDELEDGLDEVSDEVEDATDDN